MGTLRIRDLLPPQKCLKLGNFFNAPTSKANLRPSPRNRLQASRKTHSQTRHTCRGNARYNFPINNWQISVLACRCRHAWKKIIGRRKGKVFKSSRVYRMGPVCFVTSDAQLFVRRRPATCRGEMKNVLLFHFLSSPVTRKSPLYHYVMKVGLKKGSLCATEKKFYRSRSRILLQALSLLHSWYKIQG